MLLGDVIYNYRARHKLTLKDFSIISNLSVSYINQLEKNRNPKTNESIVPSLETFSKVANAMGISLDQLLSIVDENQPVGLQQSTVSSGDRVAHSECEGRGFDSLLAHHHRNHWNFNDSMVPVLLCFYQNSRC